MLHDQLDKLDWIYYHIHFVMRQENVYATADSCLFLSLWNQLSYRKNIISCSARIIDKNICVNAA